VGRKSIQAPFPKGRSKIIIVIASIFLSLVFAEALSRLILWKSQQTYGPRILYYFDENGILRLKSKSRGWHTGYSNEPTMVEINSEGFRGPELKASPAQRIIFIGDSIVFNGFVQQKQTFTALLEDQFQKDGHNVEITNAGTSDVGIKQYLLQAKHNRFDRYKPDLIVIGVYLNDSRPPQGFLGENQDKFLNFLLYSPLKHLALSHYIRWGYVTIQFKIGKKYPMRFDWVDRFVSGAWKDDLEEFQRTVIEAKFDWGAAWHVSFKTIVYPALVELRDLYVKKEARFAVVLFPVSLQVQTRLTDPFIDFPQRQLSTFAEKENIPFLDLLPFMRRDKNRRLFCGSVPSELRRESGGCRCHLSFLKGIT